MPSDATLAKAIDAGVTGIAVLLVFLSIGLCVLIALILRVMAQNAKQHDDREREANAAKERHIGELALLRSAIENQTTNERTNQQSTLAAMIKNTEAVDNVGAKIEAQNKSFTEALNAFLTDFVKDLQHETNVSSTTIIDRLTASMANIGTQDAFQAFRTSVFDHFEALPQRLAAELKPYLDRLADIQANIGEVKAKMAEIVGRLTQPTTPPVVEPPPVVVPPPPTSDLPKHPTMPVRRASDWLYETWARGYGTTGPHWIEASNNTQSDTVMKVVDDAAGPSGKLLFARCNHAAEKRAEGTGARVFWTNDGRWDTLQAYVGKTLYFRWWSYLPKMFAVQNGDGLFCEFGLQYKPGDQVVAFNVAQEPTGLRPWVWQPLATTKSADTPWRYPIGKWMDNVMKIKLSTGDDGSIDWTIDGVKVASTVGRNCADGGAGWGFALYSNAVSVADAYFGGLIVSTEPW